MAKLCTKCKTSSHRVTGMTICQSCNTIRVREWRARNRERVRKYKHDYRIANLEKSKEWDRNKRQKHAPEIKDRNRKYYASVAKFKRHERNLQRYNMSVADYEARLASQNNKCAVCNEPEPYKTTNSRTHWHVDHDHGCCSGSFSCGSCIRSLLCVNCNLMLGNARDDIAILQKAILYLIFHRSKAEATE